MEYIIKNVKIIDFGINGVGIAKTKEGKIIFINQGIPGDIVNVIVVKIKKKYLEAEIVNFLCSSIFRVNIKCKYFGICGGCKWQHLSYQKELYYKQKRVLENIKRIAKVHYDFFIFSILGAKKIFHYRNKVEFSFSNENGLLKQKDYKNLNTNNINSNVLGFHISKMSHKILHIKECFLTQSFVSDIHNYIYFYCINYNFSFYDIKSRNGLFRHVMIRSNQMNQFMIIFQLSEFSSLINNFFLKLIKKFSQITNIGYAINTSLCHSWNFLDIKWYKGEGFLIEKIENLFFRIYAKSFFQTNTKQALILYQSIRKLANFIGKELVFDFYCGIGTISQFIADQVKKVVGIDSVIESIQSANESAKKNNIYNCDFICFDLEYIFSYNLLKRYGIPDTIIIDPPSRGLNYKIINFILNSYAKKIIYVSCNPSTQCRDIKILKSCYQLMKLQVIDMFPQTDSIESICLLERI